MTSIQKDLFRHFHSGVAIDNCPFHRSVEMPSTDGGRRRGSELTSHGFQSFLSEYISDLAISAAVLGVCGFTCVHSVEDLKQFHL